MMIRPREIASVLLLAACCAALWFVPPPRPLAAATKPASFVRGPTTPLKEKRSP